MVTLSNGRTNFSFTGSIGDFSYDGNCSLKEGRVMDMNASVKLVSTEDGKDPYVGNINFNRSADENSTSNVSINIKEEYVSSVMGDVLTLVTEIEESN